MSAHPDDVSSTLLCNACQYTITTADDRTAHYRTEWHRYNIKRRVAGLQPINQSLFQQQIQLLNNKKLIESQNKVTSKCVLCNKLFHSDTAYVAHLSNKKHIKYEKQYIVQQESQKLDQQQNNDSTGDSYNTIDNVSTAQSNQNRTIIHSKSTHDNNNNNTIDNNATDESDDHKDLLSDSDSISSDIDMGAAIESYNGICLFCNKSFDTLDHCMEHMLKLHGFYIPFTGYLTNLTNDNTSDAPGLLAYLGAKIGCGHTCVYCNKRYSSTFAVQQHMRVKYHCKIKLDDEEDEEEYAPFYTFNQMNDTINSDGTQMIVSNAGDNNQFEFIGGGGVDHLNTYDELVLRDGSVLGHRSLQRVYKQVYRPSKSIISNQQQSLITQLRSKYNQLSVPYNNNNPSFKHHLPHADQVPKDVLRRAQQQRLYTELRNNNQKHFRAQMMV